MKDSLSQINSVVHVQIDTASVLGQSKILTDNFSTCTDRYCIYLYILSLCCLKLHVFITFCRK